MSFANARIYDLGDGEFEAKYSESGWITFENRNTKIKGDNKQITVRGESHEYKQNRIKTITRARGNVRRKIIRHRMFRKWELTFSENIQEISTADRHFSNLMKKINRRYPNFKYIATREFQDKNGRGAVHYHVAVNMYIPKKELDKLWGKGFTWMKAFKGDENNCSKSIYNYLTKYLTKHTDDGRLKGRHLYLCSQALDVPYADMTFDSKDDFLKHLCENYPSTTGKFIKYYEEEQLTVVI